MNSPAEALAALPRVELEPEKKSQAQRLVELVPHAALFRSTDGETAYATLPVGDHHETYPIRSKGARRWLVGRYYEIARRPPGAQALTDALGTLEARAQFEGSVHDVHVRLAGVAPPGQPQPDPERAPHDASWLCRAAHARDRGRGDTGVTPAQIALVRANTRLVERLDDLENRLRLGEDVWSAYVEAARTLAAVAPAITPEARGMLLTTKQLAERLQLSERTIRRKTKVGELRPIRMGKRGRGAVRWST